LNFHEILIVKIFRLWLWWFTKTVGRWYVSGF